MKNGLLSYIAWILVIIGGINWLLIGLLNLNIVTMIFGASLFAKIIYILVGAAACYMIYEKVKK